MPWAIFEDTFKGRNNVYTPLSNRGIWKSGHVEIESISLCRSDYFGIVPTFHRSVFFSYRWWVL